MSNSSLLKKLKQKAKYYLPVSMKKNVKYLYYAFQDFIGFLKREKRAAPPRRMNFVGSGDFEKVGQEFLEHFKKISRIKPDYKILDIGCGIGRMAQPLTEFLNEKGEYHGFDIAKKGIIWCQNHIANKHRNFNFKHANIYNKFYNQKGVLIGNNFRFPYEDKKFDFIFATSVFTHMTPEEVLHYLDEIKRTIKPEGTAFITFFLLDDQTRQAITTKKAKCNFQYKYNSHTFYSHKDNLEAEVGYKKSWLLEELEKRRLDKELKIYPGAWSGVKNPLSYQDILITQPKSK